MRKSIPAERRIIAKTETIERRKARVEQNNSVTHKYTTRITIAVPNSFNTARKVTFIQAKIERIRCLADLFKFELKRQAEKAIKTSFMNSVN